MSKDIDEKVDELEAAKEKYLSENTVISIGGYNFTPAKLMVAGAIVSSTLGGLYGVFEVYKDYMGMKEAIQTYVTPDLSGINERLSVIQKQMESTVQSVDKTTEYTNEIKNDLKSDIRRLEGVLENVERGVKQSQRDIDLSVREVTRSSNNLERETAQELRKIRNEVDDKIKKALDNPLAN
jgi:uncharacterized protein YoxC